MERSSDPPSTVHLLHEDSELQRAPLRLDQSGIRRDEEMRENPADAGERRFALIVGGRRSAHREAAHCLSNADPGFHWTSITTPSGACHSASDSFSLSFGRQPFTEPQPRHHQIGPPFSDLSNIAETKKGPSFN
jgi:hypothetical protein